MNEQPKEQLLSESAIYDLDVTAKWMRFVSIAGIIMLTITTLGFLYLLAQISKLGGSNSRIGTVVIIMVLAFIVGFTLMAILLQYANKLTAFSQDRKPLDLEEAFLKQKIYWAIIGCISILYLLFYIYTLFSSLQYRSHY